MLERAALIRLHGAAPSCVEASWTMRSENASLRLQNCGKLWFEREKEGEGFSWAPARCRSRWCPSCQNLWREPILEAYTRALPEGLAVTLATLTGGRSVQPWELRQRLSGMGRALGRWRRRAAQQGVKGGVYAWEVTEAENGRLHPHLHITVVFDPDVWWAEADGRAVDGSAKQGDLTASLAWLALTWASALEREAPGIYAELPVWCKADGTGGLLPSMEKARLHLFPELGEVEARRGAVCDIGGRWPDPEKKGQLLPRLGSGDPAENLKQTVKYTVKNGGKKLSTDAWCKILAAFKGRRRIQGFGCLHGIRAEQPEEVAASELTGKAALVETGESLGAESMQEALQAFLWRATISSVRSGGNSSLQWLECSLEGSGKDENQ